MVCGLTDSDTLFVSQTEVITHQSGQCLSRPENGNKKAIIKECDGSVGQRWVVVTTEDIHIDKSV